MDATLQSEEDKATLKRCRSPREVFKYLGKWYDLENEVATQHLFDKFQESSIPQNSNPIAALHVLEDINNQMEEKGLGWIPDTVLHARFVCALPGECVYVCVFFSFILDIKFVGRTSRGHTVGRPHRIFHPPSFCGACLNFSREKDSAIRSLVDREVEFCVLTI